MRPIRIIDIDKFNGCSLGLLICQANSELFRCRKYIGIKKIRSHRDAMLNLVMDKTYINIAPPIIILAAGGLALPSFCVLIFSFSFIFVLP